MNSSRSRQRCQPNLAFGGGALGEKGEGPFPSARGGRAGGLASASDAGAAAAAVGGAGLGAAGFTAAGFAANSDAAPPVGDVGGDVGGGRRW